MLDSTEHEHGGLVGSGVAVCRKKRACRSRLSRDVDDSADGPPATGRTLVSLASPLVSLASPCQTVNTVGLDYDPPTSTTTISTLPLTLSSCANSCQAPKDAECKAPAVQQTQPKAGLAAAWSWGIATF